MSVYYPVKKYENFGIGFGFSYSALNNLFGFDFGENFHKDIQNRIKTVMDIDRVVFESFGKIGAGFENPFSRASIEPFGHRFMPAMYGSECFYRNDGDPWAALIKFEPDFINSLEDWTIERFEKSAPVKEIKRQYNFICKNIEIDKILKNFEFNPHYRPLSSIQNAGSVINTAFSLFGDEILCLYIENPELLRKFYRNITELMLISFEYFGKLDKRPLKNVFIGNCTVAMISPVHYMDCNFAFDTEILRFAEKIKAEFTLHQDSDVNKHLKNYAQLGKIHHLDFGQDTDFEKAAGLFPGISANCIIFPSWLSANSNEVINEEIERIMIAGKAFKSFSFTLYEIDSYLAGGKIFEFYDIFRKCADKIKI